MYAFIRDQILFGFRRRNILSGEHSLKKLYLSWFIFFLVSSVYNLPAQDSTGIWLQLEPGFLQTDLQVQPNAELDDSKIAVLKIDPALYEINIYCGSNFNDKRRSIEDWATDFHLVAAINAGMYAEDYKTSIGFLKSGEHYNNTHINSKHNCIFACGPLSDNIPPVQIIDLRCQSFDTWKSQYHSFLQSIRMISCSRKNVWQQQPQKWSIAALAMDNQGNLLLIHSRAPYSVHDFIEILLKSPLDIKNAMYLEGGSAARLYYNIAGIEKSIGGFTENGIFFNDNQQRTQPIPNIIGVSRKK
jgi:hypothetical protein